jgi:hypothetical protein
MTPCFAPFIAKQLEQTIRTPAICCIGLMSREYAVWSELPAAVQQDPEG